MGQLLEGKAYGGPRHDIKLGAEYSWDGQISYSDRPDGVRKYYAGKYKWNEQAHIWVWHTARALPNSRSPRP